MAVPLSAHSKRLVEQLSSRPLNLDTCQFHHAVLPRWFVCRLLFMRYNDKPSRVQPLAEFGEFCIVLRSCMVTETNSSVCMIVWSKSWSTKTAGHKLSYQKSIRRIRGSNKQGTANPLPQRNVCSHPCRIRTRWLGIHKHCYLEVKHIDNSIYRSHLPARFAFLLHI